MATLHGGSGNDTLEGTAGADKLFGRDGDDWYVIDAADRIFEHHGGGIDTVVAGFTYSLSRNFENLVLSGTSDIDGTGNAAGNMITGNPGNNVLAGGAGDDTLDGGVTDGFVFGHDVLIGGDGDDVLVADTDDINHPDAGGVIYDGGSGNDRLYFGDTDSGINFAATPFNAVQDVEIFDLSGSGNHALMLYQFGVTNMSSTTDILQIDGGAGDRVSTTPDSDWLFAGNVVIGDQVYADYVSGAATLRVDLDIDRSGIAVVNPPEEIALDTADGFFIA
jgi:hemolysin type calcium-binding protein